MEDCLAPGEPSAFRSLPQFPSLTTAPVRPSSIVDPVSVRDRRALRNPANR
jgi:hypothetical protein